MPKDKVKTPKTMSRGSAWKSRGSAWAEKPKPEAAAEATRQTNKTMSRGSSWVQKLKASADADAWADHTEENVLGLSDAAKAWLKDAGLDAQWCTVSVFGQEQTRHYSGLMRNGWTPVNDEMARDIPDLAATLIDGLQLCVRPIELTKKARAVDAAKAQAPINNRIAMIEGGIPVSGGDHIAARQSNFMRKTIERIEIPGDGGQGE